jgi:hypothetical protein
VCNENCRAECKLCGQTFAERTPCQNTPTARLLLGHRKFIFSFYDASYFITVLKAQETFVTTHVVDSFVTNNFRIFSVQNKTPHLLNEKSFADGECPVNAKSGTAWSRLSLDCCYVMGDDQQNGPRRMTYWAKTENGRLKYEKLM